MHAVANAIRRARSGLNWAHPCLIWVADYLRDATGTDYAAAWRAEGWTEWSARRALAGLAEGGEGHSPVERAIDAFARRHGWVEANCAMQGAIMIGVFNAGAADGSPAIFDGEDRWILGHIGGGALTITGLFPDRAWEVGVA